MAITATRLKKNAKQDLGNFWWADLMSKDAAAAKEFYGRTLGWEFNQVSDEAGTMVYNSAHIGGVSTAGIGQMGEELLASGMPSAWTPYVYVADVDAICAQVAELGGTVMMPAMDVMDQGRMAIIADPTGAAFGVWQPRAHTGADAVNQPSALTWVEVYSSDLEATKRFYTELFGWGVEPMEGSDQYWLWTTDGHQFAGLMTKPEEMAQAGIPDLWVTYFGVPDVEAAAAEVKAAGGTVLWGPMQTGPGRSIGVIDPTGANVTFMQLDQWPAV
jgi:predicted enzyme related to lactoylglutathione lyase